MIHSRSPPRGGERRSRKHTAWCTMETGFPNRKLSDPALIEFAGGGGDSTREVLVEIDLPEPQVTIEPVGEERVDGSRIGVAPVSVVQAEDNTASERCSMTQRFLSDLLGEEPVWLEFAHAFIVKVNPSELREIARSRLCISIRPNSELTP